MAPWNIKGGGGGQLCRPMHRGTIGRTCGTVGNQRGGGQLCRPMHRGTIGRTCGTVSNQKGGGGQLCPQMHRGTTCPIRPCKPLHACSALHRAAARRAGGGGRRLVVVVWMHAAPGAPRKFPAPCAHLRLGGTLSISPKCKKGGGGLPPPGIFWDSGRGLHAAPHAPTKKRGVSRNFFLGGGSRSP